MGTLPTHVYEKAVGAGGYMTAYGLNSGSSRSEAIIQNAVEIMNRGDAEFPPRRGGGRCECLGGEGEGWRWGGYG